MPFINPGMDRLAEVQSLVEAAIAETHAHGIFHWNDVYPPMSIFEEDIAKGQLFVLEEDGVIKGIIVLTEERDPVYEDADWEDEVRPLEVHRITVHPDWMRTGVAGRLFDFAEEYGRENGYTSLRFDTYSENPRSLALYEKRGYTRRPGEIFFPEENELPYYCYEVRL